MSRERTEEMRFSLVQARKNPRAPQPKCIGRAEFTDYDEDHVPNEQEAADMCAGCPFFDVCLESAKQERPEWGVMGGIAWAYGRQAHWLERLGLPVNPESSP